MYPSLKHLHYVILPDLLCFSSRHIYYLVWDIFIGLVCFLSVDRQSRLQVALEGAAGRSLYILDTSIDI